MATMQPTLVGVFRDTAAAEHAAQNLENAGFGANQIYYSNRSTSGGGFMNGLKSLFTSEDAVSGNVSADLTGLGLSQDEAQYYENQYQAGRTIIAVRGNGREQEVTQIFQMSGAQTYGTQAATPRTGYTAADTGTYGTEQPAYDTDDEQRKLRLREEQLNVTKEQAQVGEVRLHKDVISEQKTIDVPVSHEEVYVERRPVTDGQIDDATPIGKDETIRIPVSAEQVNVDKNTVVTGEVAIGKRKVQETQQVSDTIRREEARVDQQGDITIHDAADDQNL